MKVAFPTKNTVSDISATKPETQQPAPAPMKKEAPTPELADYEEFLEYQKMKQMQKDKSTALELEVTQPDKEVVLPSSSSTQIAIPQQNIFSDVAGEIDRSDFKLPYVRIVAFTSKLAAEFSAGSILLEDQVVLAEPKKPLPCIVSFLKKGFIENIPYDSDVSARRYDSLAEVKGAGGIFSYKKGEGYFSEYGQVEFLFPAPESLSEQDAPFFCWDIGGSKFARAIWTFQSTSYEVVRKILTARKQQLINCGFLGGKFEISSVLVAGKKSQYWSPSIKLVGINSPDFISSARTILG